MKIIKWSKLPKDSRKKNENLFFNKCITSQFYTFSCIKMNVKSENFNLQLQRRSDELFKNIPWLNKHQANILNKLKHTRDTLIFKSKKRLWSFKFVCFNQHISKDLHDARNLPRCKKFLFDWINCFQLQSVVILFSHLTSIYAPIHWRLRIRCWYSCLKLFNTKDKRWTLVLPRSIIKSHFSPFAANFIFSTI